MVTSNVFSIDAPRTSQRQFARGGAVCTKKRRAKKEIPMPEGINRFIDSLGRMHGSMQCNGEHVLKQVIQTCQEMLADRGLKVETENDIIGAVQQNAPIMQGTSDAGASTFIFFCMEDKVGVKFLRLMNDDMRKIVVSVDGPTPVARREAMNIQFFLARDLFVNRNRHTLVPRHIAQDPESSHAKLGKSLPLILDTDPVVQYFDFPVGTVVRVDRTFGGSESTPYYRIVVKA